MGALPAIRLLLNKVPQVGAAQLSLLMMFYLLIVRRCELLDCSYLDCSTNSDPSKQRKSPMTTALRLVAPSTVNRTVMPKRRANAELRNHVSVAPYPQADLFRLE